jgi:hypothetical protein
MYAFTRFIVSLLNDMFYLIMHSYSGSDQFYRPLQFILQIIHECCKCCVGKRLVCAMTPTRLVLDRMHNTCRRSCLYLTALLPES